MKIWKNNFNILNTNYYIYVIIKKQISILIFITYEWYKCIIFYFF